MSQSFIDAVEQRAIELCAGNPFSIQTAWRQALTEVMAEAGPVAEVGSGFTLLWLGGESFAEHVKQHGIKVGHLLFTAPPADERDARIAEAEESAARWGKFAAECCRERDELRTQLAAAQAALNGVPLRIDPTSSNLVRGVINFLAAVDEQHDTQDAPLKYTVPYGALNDLRKACGAIATDQSAKGSE